MKNLVSFLGASVATVAAVSFSGVANAATLAPSSFTTLTGVVDNTATAGSTLNTTGSSNGFNNFFTAPFVALGATATQNITTSVDNGSAVTGSTFAVSAADIASGFLDVSFRVAFAGTVGTFANDGYGVQLFNASNAFVGQFFTETSPSTPTAPFFISGTRNGSLALPGTLAAGNFTLRLVLSENGGDAPGNSAVGFNNIEVNSRAQQVPFEFSPLGLVALGGAYYFAKKNKKANSEIAA
jgi:hypothetical protein